MRRSPAHLFFAFVLAIPLAVTACMDRNPVDLPDVPDPALPPSTMAMLTCTVSVRDASLACRPDEPSAPSGVSAAVIGGQGSYVRLTSTGVSYDGTSVFRADVTVENLTAQALGTADGVTPSADGVRVFFSTPPVATEGTGAVEVANADGEGFFTAAAQKYFRYEGILPPGDTSAARDWRFTVPSTVATFTFGVYVAAPVPAEAGWLSVSPLAPTMLVGWTIPMTATLRNLAGQELAGQPVSWTTSDASVATVDAQGTATAVGVGTATLTASSGGRTASVKVLVDATGGVEPGSVTRLTILNGSLRANGADSVVFSPQAQIPPFGATYSMEVILRHPSGAQRLCRAGLNTFIGCRVKFAPGSLGGAWRVERVEVSNRFITHAELLAAGAPAHVYVQAFGGEDRTPPGIDSVTLAPAAVTPSDTVRLTVKARDDEIGVEYGEAWVSSPGNPQMRWFNRRIIHSDATRMEFWERIPDYYRGGTFTLDSVRVQDYNNNRVTLNTSELVARGFATQFTVAGTDPDTVPPTITGFTVTPDTVAGNGADPVRVTLSASEPADGAGVWFLDMEFEKVSDVAQRRRCLLNGAVRVSERTMTCTRTFGPADAGAWRVRYIRAIDFMNNARELSTQQLQAAGYPTALTVMGTTPDLTAPTIAAFSYSPRTVAGNGVDSVTVTLTATEPPEGTGLWFMDLVIERVSNPTQFRRCLLNDPGARRTLTLVCRQAFATDEAGAWRVRYVRAIDVANNTRLLRTADLQAAGLPTDLAVTSP